MASYKIYDDSGRLISTVVSVLTPVQLTAIGTSSSSNIITVASITGCYPGMPVSVPYIPQGSFIAGFKSSTEIVLACTGWNATTGVFTTSTANANASTTGSGLIGYAYGYSPMCLIQNFFPLGTWRNLITSQYSYKLGGTSAFESFITANAEVTGFAFSGTPTTSTPTYGIKSDVLSSTPLKRHNGEPWGYYPFISTGGLLTAIPANPQYQIVLSSAT
jgi:hypothetical protein